MTINTKYDIGQKIWITYEHNGEVHVYSDTIIEIVCNTAGKILYFCNNHDDEIPEEYIIVYEDNEALIKQIKNLLEP